MTVDSGRQAYLPNSVLGGQLQRPDPIAQLKTMQVMCEATAEKGCSVLLS